MTAGPDISPRKWSAGAVAGALPPLLPTLGGAILWGAAMAASALLVLVFENWETPQKIRTVAGLFAAGGFVAFPFAIVFARFLSHRRGGEVAFAAAFLCLALATVAATGGFYAIDYRAYYAEWHADPLTRIWFLQFAYTVAAAYYQFAVLGLRLFFPAGLLALIIASFWFARLVR